MLEEYNDVDMVEENVVLDIIRRGLSPEALQVNDGNTSPYVTSVLELERLKIVLQDATTIAHENPPLGISVQLRLPVVVESTEHTRLWTIVLAQAKDPYYKTMIHDALSRGFATVLFYRDVSFEPGLPAERNKHDVVNSFYKHAQSFHEICAKACLSICGFTFDDKTILFHAVEGVLPNLGIEVNPAEWTLSSILVILPRDD